LLVITWDYEEEAEIKGEKNKVCAALEVAVGA